MHSKTARIWATAAGAAYAMVRGYQALRYGNGQLGMYIVLTVVYVVTIWFLWPVLGRLIEKHICPRCPFRE